MPGKKYRNPVPTVDIIIEMENPGEPRKIVLIKRRNAPFGWALPGGFVDYGESLEEAAVREAKEETSLDIELLSQFHAYSNPRRDPRLHTISTVFIAQGRGIPRAADDACELRVLEPGKISLPLAFDHREILNDYIAKLQGKDPWTKKKKTK
jgi:ADP-ribose pyrophosphatase YjhB (NUDIX family)